MSAIRIGLKSQNKIAEKLGIAQHASALKMQHLEPRLSDEAGAALVERVDYDFMRIRLQKMDPVGVLLRARQFDRWTRDFLSRRRAPVVHIGCGLDARFVRVDDGRAIWYDLDLPEVITRGWQLLEELGREEYWERYPRPIGRRLPVIALERLVYAVKAPADTLSDESGGS